MLYSSKKSPINFSTTYSIKTHSKNMSARQTRDNTFTLNKSRQNPERQKQSPNQIKFQISQLEYNKKIKKQADYSKRLSKSTQAHQPMQATKKSHIKNTEYRKFIESFKNCITKKSYEQHSPVQAYAVCSKMNASSGITNQQICIYFGQKIKILSLIEGYQGSYAANFIKKQLPGEFVKKWKYSQDNNLHNFLQIVVHQTFSSLQERLQKQQNKFRDKSAASILCIVLDDKRVLVANCGISQAICYTKNKKILLMNRIHDTSNQSEIDRIISKGVRLYRTIINAPFSTNLSLSSPIRISPSGLTYTRSIGYAVTAEKQRNSIISMPQLKYINIDDIQWLTIMSNEMSSKIQNEFIVKTIQAELSKITLEYTTHHIAEICTRKIVAEGVRKGIDDAISVIIVFLGVKQYNGTNIINANFLEQNRLQMEQKKNKVKQQLKKNNEKTRSLKYVGNRKSFFKEGDR